MATARITANVLPAAQLVLEKYPMLMCARVVQIAMWIPVMVIPVAEIKLRMIIMFARAGEQQRIHPDTATPILHRTGITRTLPYVRVAHPLLIIRDTPLQEVRVITITVAILRAVALETATVIHLPEVQEVVVGTHQVEALAVAEAVDLHPDLREEGIN